MVDPRGARTSKDVEVLGEELPRGEVVGQGHVTLLDAHDVVTAHAVPFEELVDAVGAHGERKIVAHFWQNFSKISLVFGCIGADLCK